jgi:hypothetical protein
MRDIAFPLFVLALLSAVFMLKPDKQEPLICIPPAIDAKLRPGDSIEFTAGSPLLPDGSSAPKSRVECTSDSAKTSANDVSVLVAEADVREKFSIPESDFFAQIDPRVALIPLMGERQVPTAGTFWLVAVGGLCLAWRLS